MRNNYLPVLKQSTVLHKTTIASCAVKTVCKMCLFSFFLFRGLHKPQKFQIYSTSQLLSIEFILHFILTVNTPRCEQSEK